MAQRFDPLAFQTKGMTTTTRFALLVAIEGEGTLDTPLGVTLYDKGSVVTINATPSENSGFSHWKEYPNITSPTITLTITENMTITPVFIDLVRLTTICVGDGTRGGTPDGVYNRNEMISLIAIPSTGWCFNFWMISNKVISRNTAYYKRLGDSEEIKAVFSEIFYTITVLISGEGDISPKRKIKAYYGEELTITATPEVGWMFSHWEFVGNTAENPTTFMVQGDATIRANFQQIDYTITTDVVGNGSITVEPQKDTYQYNDLVTVTAVPNGSAVFDEWSGNLTGKLISTKVRVTRNMAITATFL